ncbi:hypothetical protein CVT25_012363 [Psilocybe cyanescens]|uniref:Uncharacterized protein n=1 Tax=Psilocybe cyanescens TaxID=93625 RepID=A0A409X7I8_PSICY|nr:hypothetical protein CVT25_012363 [Psilocybe cyanescens]
MPHRSTRPSSKENQTTDAATHTTGGQVSNVQKTLPLSLSTQPGVSKNTCTADRPTHKQAINKVPSGQEESSVSSHIKLLNIVLRKSFSAPSQASVNFSPTLSATLSNSTNMNVGNTEELQSMRDERDCLLAEVQSLHNQVNATQSFTSTAPSAPVKLIPCPQGRHIQLREDMGLADDMNKFLAIRRSMKDALQRAGLDPMVHWEYQSKDKLAKVFWVYIHAYMRHVGQDGTNATLPDVNAEEFSDSQGKVASDLDMHLDGV